MTKISKRKWIQRKQVHHWNKNPTYNATSSLQHPSFAYENVTLKIYLPTKIIFVTIKYKTKRRCFKRDYMIFFFLTESLLFSLEVDFLTWWASNTYVPSMRGGNAKLEIKVWTTCRFRWWDTMNLKTTRGCRLMRSRNTVSTHHTITLTLKLTKLSNVYHQVVYNALFFFFNFLLKVRTQIINVSGILHFFLGLSCSTPF